MSGVSDVARYHWQCDWHLDQGAAEVIAMHVEAERLKAECRGKA